MTAAAHHTIGDATRSAQLRNVPPRPLRVCHVSLTLATGGMERLLADIARLHDPAVCRPEFLAITEDGPFADQIRGAGCVAETLDGEPSGRPDSRWCHVRRVDSMRRRFQDRGYDVVHTHNTYPHVYATLAARLARIPVVINTRHGQRIGHGRKSRALFRLASRWTDRVVAVSDDAARLTTDTDGIPPHKVSRIWNGIDTRKFCPRAASHHIAKPVAIAVGRLSPEKDFETLIESVALATPVVPGLRLRIVGDGSQRDELERLARRRHVDDRVTFLGERHDVPRLLHDAGFYVTSSLSEGISLTLLEAMAAGLPVIATDVGGTREVISDASVGRLVPPADPRSFADEIGRLWAERGRWPAIENAARHRVTENFDVRRMTAEYERLYVRLATSAGLASCQAPRERESPRDGRRRSADGGVEDAA